MIPFARILIILGVALVVIGGLIYLFARMGLPLGRLPGDIHIQAGNVSCFIPLVTSILLSIFLTIVLNLVIRIINR
jgi:hypothetical protein